MGGVSLNRSNDVKAQKNGAHRSVYWVSNTKYIGEWKDNLKDGFGIQIYKNGDKYEGLWGGNKRHGQGTYWKNESGKLRREYTGDWIEGKKHGRGTYFYKNGDRFDGFWVLGKPQGEGRMIEVNGDIYEG